MLRKCRPPSTLTVSKTVFLLEIHEMGSETRCERGQRILVVALLLPALESVAGTKAVASAGFNQRDLKDPDVYAWKLAAFLTALGVPNTSRENHPGKDARGLMKANE